MVAILTADELDERMLAENTDQSPPSIEWREQVRHLIEKANERGDGVAVYVNHDLGHPDLGQWQVVTYGSETSLLETRGQSATPQNAYEHGGDVLPMTLPDIGGAINWRYTLEVIVPATKES